MYFRIVCNILLTFLREAKEQHAGWVQGFSVLQRFQNEVSMNYKRSVRLVVMLIRTMARRWQVGDGSKSARSTPPVVKLMLGVPCKERRET